jgi:hypothetical protein
VFDFDSGITNFYDGGVLEYTVNGGASWFDAGGLFDWNGYRGTMFSGTGNPLGGRSGFVGDSHGYISSRLNLASLAGQSVRFRWRMGLDVSVAFFGWLVDDVQVYTCVTPAVTANSVAPVSGTGLTQTFTLQYDDNLGVGDMASAWVWFSPSLSAASSNCV